MVKKVGIHETLRNLSEKQASLRDEIIDRLLAKSSKKEKIESNKSYCLWIRNCMRKNKVQDIHIGPDDGKDIDVHRPEMEEKQIEKTQTARTQNLLNQTVDELLDDLAQVDQELTALYTISSEYLAHFRFLLFSSARSKIAHEEV